MNYKISDYITLKISYGDYFNKFYKIIHLPTAINRYKLVPLFDKDAGNANGYLYLLDEDFRKSTQKEIEEIELKIASNKYNL